MKKYTFFQAILLLCLSSILFLNCQKEPLAALSILENPRTVSPERISQPITLNEDRPFTPYCFIKASSLKQTMIPEEIIEAYMRYQKKEIATSLLASHDNKGVPNWKNVYQGQTFHGDDAYIISTVYPHNQLFEGFLLIFQLKGEYRFFPIKHTSIFYACLQGQINTGN